MHETLNDSLALHKAGYTEAQLLFYIQVEIENHKCKSILTYKVSLRPAWNTGDPIPPKKSKIVVEYLFTL